MGGAGSKRRALLGLTLATGCAVPDIDLEGRPCPCLGGWQCDETTQTCVRETTLGDSESSIDGEFDIAAFSADWSTPQSVHWTWELQGAEEDFRAYELWVATSADALAKGDVIVFNRDVNPELGRFSLANTNGVDFVVGTITDGLKPGTEYYGQLHVLDTAGGRTVSPNVAVRPTNAEPTSSLIIFADEDPFSPGFSLPACLGRTEAVPSEGTHHFELFVECSADGMTVCEPVSEPAPECFENLRIQNLELATASIGGGDFVDAFLEIDIAIVPLDDSPAHGWWGDISIQGSDRWTGLHGITLRADGEYRRYQIPLTQMGLTPETFGGVVRGVRVGSQWRRGVVVRFDEVTLRW